MALMHTCFTYYFIVFLHTLCLSFDEAGTVFPLMLPGSFRQSIVVTDMVLNDHTEMLAVGQTLTSEMFPQGPELHSQPFSFPFHFFGLYLSLDYYLLFSALTMLCLVTDSAFPLNSFFLLLLELFLLRWR